MNTILFATDFRKSAVNALQYTLFFAEKLNAKVILFHAFGTGELLTKAEKLQRKNEIVTALEKFFIQATSLEQRQSIKVAYLTDSRFAYEAIPKVVMEQNVDLTILGMKKGSHSFDVLFGNTTSEILLALESAVMIIPEEFKIDEIQRLGCTTDFKFRDIALINLLRDFGKCLGEKSSIHCLHVLEKEAEEDRVKKDMEVLYSVFENRKGTPVYFEIESGKLTPTIEDFVIIRELDMLVMNSHQRAAILNLLVKSTTRRLSRDITIPLLIIKNL